MDELGFNRLGNNPGHIVGGDDRPQETILASLLADVVFDDSVIHDGNLDLRGIGAVDDWGAEGRVVLNLHIGFCQATAADEHTQGQETRKNYNSSINSICVLHTIFFLYH